MTYLVLATVRNVLGEDTEIAADKDGENPIRFTGAVTQNANMRFFPSFGAPFKEEE